MKRLIVSFDGGSLLEQRTYQELRVKIVAESAIFARFAVGLDPFFRRHLAPHQCHQRVASGVDKRTASFLHTIEFGIFRSPGSPYRRLFDHCGISLSEVRHLLATRSVEETLEELCDAGIYVRTDEFKGRRPVERGSLKFDVGPRDFDNPLIKAKAGFQTGGSGGRATRLSVDLDHYTQDAVYEQLHLEAFGMLETPQAVWLSAPPYVAGFKTVMSNAKIGRIPERWFSQEPPFQGWRAWKEGFVMAWTMAVSRLYRQPLPFPEHVPLDQARRVAEWLAEKKRAGCGGLLATNVASAVRVCAAAEEAGLDIAGMTIRVAGEPLTTGRASHILSTGCRVTCAYAMGEVGRVGFSCSNPVAPDDIHLFTDKLALLQRDLGPDIGQAGGAFLLTTLLPATPKLLLNVETGDCGVVEQRSCGCRFEDFGLTTHLHTIRSYEKLTSEGMSFLGSDLARLVEEVLPARFGGRPTDFQLVEEEEATGLSRVSIIIRPSVGQVEEKDAIEAVLGFLNQIPNASADYGERWRAGDTLRVRRCEPYATSASKVLALHTFKSEGAPVLNG